MEEPSSCHTATAAARACQWMEEPSTYHAATAATATAGQIGAPQLRAAKKLLHRALGPGPLVEMGQGTMGRQGVVSRHLLP